MKRRAFQAALTALIVSVIVICTGCEFALHGSSTSPLGMVRLYDVESRVKRFSDYPAKIVVVNFWASWCVSCLAEMRQLDALQARFSRRDLQILGVMIDDANTNLERAERSGALRFPLLLDKNDDAKRLFAVSALPTTIALDCRGKSINLWDPVLKTAVKRIVGPREWDSEENVERLRALIQSAHC